MLSNFFLKSFRLLLIPFSLIYGSIIKIRNLLYDKKIFTSYSYGLPLINVGNLSIGGTGKTPMVEYLIDLLNAKYKIAILSRGYKRKTRGYLLASENTTALEIGDEPMQFHLKYFNVPIAVGEKRALAIPQLLHDKPLTEVIILDDAFQHRKVKPGLSLLLTDFSNLYTRDFFLPTGDLRDAKSSAKRAQIIIVTKSPELLSVTNKELIIEELNPLLEQTVFFTHIEYGNPYHLFNNEWIMPLTKNIEVLLVTGIANATPLKNWIDELSHSYTHILYSDHHIFTIEDIKDIKNKFQLLAGNKIIITTEKDAVRLLKFKDVLIDMPLFIVPIKINFLFNEQEKFNSHVLNYIQQHSKNMNP